MDDDKPFTCDVKGCKQKFANSDHLAVHNQKHLNVKLGFKTSESLVDQTPTPTRFLRNFDEEGGLLFADLDNPFDQDFKKASASSSSSPAVITSSVVSQTQSNDTPSIVAPTATTSSDAFAALTTLSYISSLSNEVTSSKAVLNSSTIVVREKSDVAVVASSAASLPGLSKNIVRIIVDPKNRVPKATVMPAISSAQHKGQLGSSIMSVPTPAIVTSGSALPNGGNTMNSNNNHDSAQNHAMSIAKQKLKETLQQHAALSNASMVRQMTASDSPPLGHLSSSPSPTNSVSTIEDDVDGFYNSPHSGQKRSRRSQDELDPDQRRNKFLERNRAAASRCRQKRKIWVQQLEKKADDLGATNSHLQGEITSLRAEVAQLKALLLAHKDCPVTLQQQQPTSYATMPNGSFIGLTADGGRVTLVANGGSPSTSSAEEVASTALTDMASRATMEMGTRVPSSGTIVITSVAGVPE